MLSFYSYCVNHALTNRTCLRCQIFGLSNSIQIKILFSLIPFSQSQIPFYLFKLSLMLIQQTCMKIYESRFRRCSIEKFLRSMWKYFKITYSFAYSIVSFQNGSELNLYEVSIKLVFLEYFSTIIVFLMSNEITVNKSRK